VVDAKSGHDRPSGFDDADDGSRAARGERGEPQDGAGCAVASSASSINLMISSHRWAGVIVALLS